MIIFLLKECLNPGFSVLMHPFNYKTLLLCILHLPWCTAVLSVSIVVTHLSIPGYAKTVAGPSDDTGIKLFSHSLCHSYISHNILKMSLLVTLQWFITQSNSSKKMRCLTITWGFSDSDTCCLRLHTLRNLTTANVLTAVEFVPCARHRSKYTVFANLFNSHNHLVR